jgi:hypothetical protein
MLQREKYRIKDGQTALNAEELNARFFDLDGRIHTLEGLKVSWEDAITAVQAFGLERINGVVQPVLEAANSILTEIEATLQALRDDQTAVQDTWASLQTSIQDQADAVLQSVQGDQADFQAWWDTLADTIARLEAYTHYSYLYMDAAALGEPASTQAAAEATFLEINGWRFDVRAFNNTEVAVAKARTPEDWDAGEIKIKVAWMGADGCSAGDTVNWVLRAKASGPGEPIIDPWGTPQTVSGPVTAPNNLEESAYPAFTLAGSPAAGDYLYIWIQRGAGSLDLNNMTEKALLLGVTIQFKTTGQVAGW